MKKFGITKQNLSFILCLLSILGFFGLAYFKGVDISSVIPVIIGIYVGARATEKSVSIYSASKDPKADTQAVIRDLNGISSTPDNPDK